MTNPYLDARRTWNEALGATVANARMLKAAVTILLVSNVGLVAGIIYFANRSELVPYVMVLSEGMTPLSMGMPNARAKDDMQVLRSFIARFVIDLRTVTADATVLKKQYKRLYSMLSPGTQAFMTISDGFREDDPFKRAATELVSVDIHTVLLQSDRVWEVEWSERRSGRRGEGRGERSFRAYIHTEKVRSKDANVMMENPLGIMVKGFEYSEKLGESGSSTRG